jgi:hypothetical protein
MTSEQIELNTVAHGDCVALLTTQPAESVRGFFDCLNAFPN